MMKKITLFLLILLSFNAKSQDKNLENYKYIIVPNKFSYFTQEDQYKTSSLMKFLFKKKGFTVFLDNETFPQDLVDDGCLALKAEFVDKSDFFKVKSLIQIKDCYNRIIYTSKIGKTKEKKYNKAYLLAIRDAYNSMTDFVYSYKEKSTKSKIVNVKKTTPLVKSEIKTKPLVVKVENKNKEAKKVKQEVKLTIKTLYAQEKENGYQLVNTKPEVVFHLLKTKNKDIFIVKNKNGILYKNENTWIVEYYKNDKLYIEEYLIKF